MVLTSSPSLATVFCINKECTLLRAKATIRIDYSAKIPWATSSFAPLAGYEAGFTALR